MPSSRMLYVGERPEIDLQLEFAVPRGVEDLDFRGDVAGDDEHGDVHGFSRVKAATERCLVK